jgi:hypothetical protein
VVFFSDRSSLVDDNDPAVGGGEKPAAKSLLFLRLLTDDGRREGDWWTDGGREDDTIGVDVDGSRFIDRRLSENEALPSLMRSLITVIEDLRSFKVVFEAFESRLSRMVSF